MSAGPHQAYAVPTEAAAVRAPRYEHAARRITYAALIGAMAQVALTVAGLYGGFRLLMLSTDVALPGGALLPALIAGSFVAHRVARRLSRIIGGSVARPIEMIVSHLAASGDDVIDRFRAPTGRRLDVAALMADEAFLRLRFALAEERTREVLADLEEARAEANQQNLAKSQFMANMSHELRTPLNAILGYAMLLQEDAAAARDTSVVADLERIALSGRELLVLINNLLDLSRLETGKVVPAPTIVDLKTLLASVSADVAGDIAKQGGSLVILPSADVGMLSSDGLKIAKCLSHLVRFAADAGPAREISLALKPTSSIDGVASVEFTIWLPDQDDNLIAAFRVLEASLATAGDLEPRTMGVQIARKIAQLLGGDVEVVRGTDGCLCLRLSVPLGTAKDVERDKQHLPSCDEAAAMLADARKIAADARCALVIDDNPEALDLMQRWLGKLGYSVAIASDGNRGLALAASCRFDLIILDVFMEGPSGYDVLAQLRGSARTRATPVIMYTVEDDRARSLDAGASDHVCKPVSEQQLRGLLQIYREPMIGDLLIIDDNDRSAEFLEGCAKQIGLTSRRASNDAEGLALARASRPSGVLLDMSESRGFKQLQALLADDAFAGVPVVVLSTGVISSSDHRRIEEAGYRLLPKGLHFPREIAATIKEMVG